MFLGDFLPYCTVKSDFIQEVKGNNWQKRIQRNAIL